MNYCALVYEYFERTPTMEELEELGFLDTIRIRNDLIKKRFKEMKSINPAPTNKESRLYPGQDSQR